MGSVLIATLSDLYPLISATTPCFKTLKLYVRILNENKIYASSEKVKHFNWPRHDEYKWQLTYQ